MGGLLSNEAVGELTAQVVAAVQKQLAQGTQGAQSPYVNMRGLAAYAGWGYGTVQKMSAANLIPGKIVHGGKVSFDLRKVDPWLRSMDVGPS